MIEKSQLYGSQEVFLFVIWKSSKNYRRKKKEGADGKEKQVINLTWS